MTLHVNRPRARRKWVGMLGVIALVSALAAGATFAVHDDGKFELDKNASGNTNVTAVGYLASNINATTGTLNVCEIIATGDPTPAAGDIILIRAERMTLVSNGSGTFGGNCAGVKRVYTVATPRPGGVAQSGGANNVGARISLIRSETKAGPDWDQVFASVTADDDDMGDDDKCLALGLVECTYIEDGIGPTIFIGGNTKDHILTSSWQHTTGSSPDKGEILNAYAAKAISPAADNADNKDHQILYFGMDRYAVDGSTDIGFWFFKEKIEALPDGTFGPGTQSVGDILALGTFTQGGATSNIRVFQWVGSGGNESGTIEGPVGVNPDCVPGSANDPGCATVNNTTIEVPWEYTFKGESTGGWVPLGGFFEGGIDLTANNLDGCFSSFLAETRSSPEITAVLKDFALGSFEACDTGLSTVPGDGTAGTGNAALTDTDDPANGIVDISIGTGSVSVRDRASLTISGVSTWSGTMDFWLCKLDGTDLCDGTTGKVGTKIGNTINVTQATPQPILSEAAQVTSTGRYCWRGTFTSTTTGVPSRTDSSINECFEVLPVTPMISTNATAVVELESTISDTATLGGTATQPGSPIINGPIGADAGGTITFKVYGPNDDDCEGTGTTVSTETVAGDDDYTSDDYTPTAPGTYQWVASYSGNSPNTNPKSGACGDANETSTVVDAKIELSPLTATNEVGDEHTITATVSQDIGSGWEDAPDGTLVTFSLLDNTAGADFTPTSTDNTCTTVDGECSVTINTSTAGDVDIHATTTFTVAGLELTRATDGTGSNSVDANKIYVDASIAISPLTATNNIGESHVFTITVTWEPAGAETTVTSITPSINPTPDEYEDTCETPDLSVADAASCTVTINDGSAGTFTLNATAVLEIEGLTVTRDTDSATTEIGAGPDGTGAATKTYLEGSLTWLKHDQDGELLGGATFEVCQTHVLVTTGITPTLVEIVDENDAADPICQSVDDDVATDDDPDVVPDTDDDAGEFKLEGLSLGTWTIRETAAPDGYAFDDELTQTVELTFEIPNGSATNPFVNTKQYKIIIFVCNQSLGTLEASDVILNGESTVTASDIPAGLGDLTEAMLCGLTDADGSVYPDLDAGDYTPTITIPKAS